MGCQCPPGVQDFVPAELPVSQKPEERREPDTKEDAGPASAAVGRPRNVSLSDSGGVVANAALQLPDSHDVLRKDINFEAGRDGSTIPQKGGDEPEGSGASTAVESKPLDPSPNGANFVACQKGDDHKRIEYSSSDPPTVPSQHVPGMCSVCERTAKTLWQFDQAVYICKSCWYEHGMGGHCS